MNAPSPASLKAASIALADDDENVDLALAIKVAAMIDAERAACEQAVRDSGIKTRGNFACAFATIEAAIEAIKARGKL